MDSKHLDGNSALSGASWTPSWVAVEVCSLAVEDAGILRAEVTPDAPEGASWIISLHLDSQAVILQSGSSTTISAAKAEIVDVMAQVRERMRHSS